MGSTGRQQIQGLPLLQLFWDTHEDQATHLLHMWKSSPYFLVGGSVSGSLQGYRLADSVGLLLESLSQKDHNFKILAYC